MSFFGICFLLYFFKLLARHGFWTDNVNVAELSEYSYKSLVYKEEIGLGGYAVVFTAKLSGEGRRIVVKKLLDSLGLAKCSMIKEARLLLNFH